MNNILQLYEKALCLLRTKINEDLHKLYGNGHVIKDFEIDKNNLTISAECVKCGKRHVFTTDLVNTTPMSFGFLLEGKCNEKTV
jgi:hypothetical protein